MSSSPASSPKIVDPERNDAASLEAEDLPIGALPVPHVDEHHGLHRGLSARQVSMIAIAGTIGTGLFLGTGSSLAHGGPASMLICYALVGFIVWVTLLLLGEMATQYPVAGELLQVHALDSGRILTACRQARSTRTPRVSSRRLTALPSHGIIGSMTQCQSPRTSQQHS